MRNRLTDDIVNHMIPGQGASQAALMALDTETLSASGACSLAIDETRLAVSGTMAFTLADGTVAGQRKRISCVSAASTPLGTLTIASPETATGSACSATFIFTNAGQAVDLVWTGSKWRATRVERAGSLTVVVGTDVLTGQNLVKNYLLSVTGTVSSTGTKALPNGSAVGEVCHLSNSVAASTPIGNINGTYLNMIGAAKTDMGAIGVVGSDTALGDFGTFVWTGAAWQVLNFAGVTFS